MKSVAGATHPYAFDINQRKEPPKGHILDLPPPPYPIMLWVSVRRTSPVLDPEQPPQPPGTTAFDLADIFLPQNDPARRRFSPQAPAGFVASAFGRAVRP
jgi:hypothetical protein